MPASVSRSPTLPPHMIGVTHGSPRAVQAATVVCSRRCPCLAATTCALPEALARSGLQVAFSDLCAGSGLVHSQSPGAAAAKCADAR